MTLRTLRYIDDKGLVDTAVAELGGIDTIIMNHVIGFYEDWSARIMRGQHDPSCSPNHTF